MHNHYQQQPVHLSRNVLFLAVLSALAGLAVAEENDEVERLIKPESQISLGVGHVSGDNQRFGVYNGLKKEGDYFIGDFSLVRRAEDTGTWLRAEGRNIGLSTAEARLEHERQGDWGYFLEVNQIPRYAPYEIHSNLRGAGTNNLTVSDPSPATANQLPGFKTERTASKFGFNKFFMGDLLEFKVLFQNEEKKGERLFGRGNIGMVNGALAMGQEFLAEPINSTTRQLDAILNYTGDKLQLSGGYYGSWYLNNNNQLNVAGGAPILAGAVPPFSVIALPPDNFAHQLHLSGGYQFTDKTRGNFKVAYSHAGQTDSFVGLPAGLNISGRSDLGGKVDTTLAQFGVTSRPISNLSLLANVRYEDRHDQTTIARYIALVPPPPPAVGYATTDGFNEPRSLRTFAGKLEASYLLPRGYRVTGGVDREDKERSIAGVRVVGYREKTEEVSYRLELKRALAESVSGSIAYIHSDRDGSDYRTLAKWNINTQQLDYTAMGLYSNLLQPIYIADRNRDKLRLLVDWAPLDALSVQFAVEGASDYYGAGRGNPDVGPRRGEARLYSVDAAYSLNDRWRLSGWTTWSKTTMDQSSAVGLGVPPVPTYWDASIRNRAYAYGLGLRGQLTGTVDLGADLVLTRDHSSYAMGGAAADSLPDIRSDLASLRTFVRYALSKDTSVRLNYVYDQRKTNDWTWNGTQASNRYVYTDGSWLYQRPEDKVHFIGVALTHSFR